MSTPLRALPGSSRWPAAPPRPVWRCGSGSPSARRVGSAPYWWCRARGLRRNGWSAGAAVATRLVGVVGLLVIAAMLTVGLGDLGGLVQRLFVALLFGAPVVPACLQRAVAAVS